MFCQKCGKENPDEAKYCKHCGHDLKVQETPPDPVKQPLVVKPKNWLVESILVTILCCLPLGVVGIVYASKVDNLYSSGDTAGAQDASDKAKKFVTWGAVAGVVIGIIYFIVALSSGGW